MLKSQSLESLIVTKPQGRLLRLLGHHLKCAISAINGDEHTLDTQEWGYFFLTDQLEIYIAPVQYPNLPSWNFDEWASGQARDVVANFTNYADHLISVLAAADVVLTNRAKLRAQKQALEIAVPNLKKAMGIREGRSSGAAQSTSLMSALLNMVKNAVQPAKPVAGTQVTFDYSTSAKWITDINTGISSIELVLSFNNMKVAQLLSWYNGSIGGTLVSPADVTAATINMICQEYTGVGTVLGTTPFVHAMFTALVSGTVSEYYPGNKASYKVRVVITPPPPDRIMGTVDAWQIEELVHYIVRRVKPLKYPGDV